MSNLLIHPRPIFQKADLTANIAGTLEFYEAGTSTPLDTYSDYLLATPNANPLTLNAYGQPSSEIYLKDGEGYKIICKNSAGTELWTVDDYYGVAVTASSLTDFALTGATNKQGMTYDSANSEWVPDDILVLDTGGAITAGVSITAVELIAVGAAITPDMSAGNVFYHTLTADVTLNNPSSVVSSGQPFALIFIQDGTGGWEVTYGSDYRTPDGVTPDVSATAAAISALGGLIFNDGTDDLVLIETVTNMAAIT